MNHVILKSGLLLTAVSVGAAARASDQDDFWGRFSLSYRAAFNVSANFSGVGGYAPPGNGAPGAYNNGFVGVDSTQNAGGYTTYWGYTSSGQVSGNDIIMQRSVASGVSSGNQDSGVQNGIELSYEQPLGGGKRWHWGLEAAVNWTGINIRDDRTLAGNVVTTTDAYSLNGSVAPLAPYTGTVEGPGPLLATTPDSHSVATEMNAALITGSRKIDANLVGFRLGPYLELPVCRHFSLELGGGLSFGVISSDFSYDESVVINGLPAQMHTGSAHDVGGLVGGYIRAQADIHLNRRLSLIGGVEFNDLGTYDQTAGSETAHLDLSQSLYVNAGLSYRF